MAEKQRPMARSVKKKQPLTVLHVLKTAKGYFIEFLISNILG